MGWATIQIGYWHAPSIQEGRFTMKKQILFILGFGFLSICFLAPFSLSAGETTGLSNGQMIYVPAYSHIYIGDYERPFLLTVTLSIRNVDPGSQIKITAVDYFQNQGKLLNKKIDRPVVLNPLESIRYIIPEKDNTGGSGANFIVQWVSDQPVNPPIVETVMIGAQSKQGISFTSRGQVIIQKKE